MESIKSKMILKIPKKYSGVDRIPEIVVFTEENFEGIEYRTNCDLYFVGEMLNDKIKSIIVISGTWEVFEHKDYDGKVLGKLIPGYFPTYKDIDSLNKKNKISSIKCINP